MFRIDERIIAESLIDGWYREVGISEVTFGANAGPHNLVLSGDDRRLVVTDYFLNEDAKGIIHFEGDHKVHVLKVTHDTLTEDKRFNLDFNTAFKTGPARPHGIANEIAPTRNPARPLAKSPGGIIEFVSVPANSTWVVRSPNEY